MNKRKKKFSTAKKSLKAFMQDESGFVSKDAILKIGIGTVASLGIMNSVSAHEWWNEYVISSGTDLPQHNESIWINSNFAGIHQNSTVFEQVVTNPNCSRLIHSNGTLASLSHSSNDFHMHAWGRLDAKGWHARINFPNRADSPPGI
tara:strand:- start:113 stop:553 length:441 start_codon:yes stop_codon:yes gene_type:complete